MGALGMWAAKRRWLPRAGNRHILVCPRAPMRSTMAYSVAPHCAGFARFATSPCAAHTPEELHFNHANTDCGRVSTDLVRGTVCAGLTTDISSNAVKLLAVMVYWSRSTGWRYVSTGPGRTKGHRQAPEYATNSVASFTGSGRTSGDF